VWRPTARVEPPVEATKTGQPYRLHAGVDSLRIASSGFSQKIALPASAAAMACAASSLGSTSESSDAFG
jgi:hypothetical protein